MKPFFRAGLSADTGMVLLFLLSFLLLPGCRKTDVRGGSDELPSKSNHMTSNLKAVDKKLIADGMTSPIGLVAAPDKSGRLFVIDQVGRVWIIDAAGNRLATPFIDVSSKMVALRPGYDERGLLGLAFHPQYSQNGKFYMYYTAPPTSADWNNLSRIAEFRVSTANPNLADPVYERKLIELNDPQSNHNGGTIEFGPDGYLYIAIGDGGGANDVGFGHVEDWYPVNQGGNGQDITSNLFGSILRIDVNGGSPYRIPGDNPFVGKAGLDEIWAYGFRNPFRFSFDLRGSRDLYAGDAGQVLFEEIDVVKKGGNYGWNVKEGTHCFSTANPSQTLPSCPDRDNFGNKLIDPVIELNNAANPAGGRATTIIGGNVYRGNSIPGFQGKYIFGTFSQGFTNGDGELFIANPAGKGLWPFQELSLKSTPDDIGYFLKGFGQDRQGEIYLTVSSNLGPSGTTGKVFKLVPAAETN